MKGALRVGALCLLLALGAAAVIVAMTDLVLTFHGWVALILGVTLTILVTVGLMGLLFYSSRHGYDEGPPREEE